MRTKEAYKIFQSWNVVAIGNLQYEDSATLVRGSRFSAALRFVSQPKLGIDDKLYSVMIHTWTALDRCLFSAALFSTDFLEL